MNKLGKVAVALAMAFSVGAALAANADPTLKAELDSNGFAVACGIEEDSPYRRTALGPVDFGRPGMMLLVR